MRARRVPAAFAALATLFVSVPSIVTVIASLSTGTSIGFPPRGITTRWYGVILSQPGLGSAAVHSLIVGVEATALGLLVGVPAALGLYRHSVRFWAGFSGFLGLGFASPLIVSGLAFLVLFTHIGHLGSIFVVGFCVGVVNLPFMLWTVSGSVTGRDPELEGAAATLGADEVQQFVFITLPGLKPGIVAGSLLVFVFSITEFLVSLIITNTYDQTLPVFLFGSIRGVVSPSLAAIATAYIVVAALIVGGLQLSGGLKIFLADGSGHE